MPIGNSEYGPALKRRTKRKKKDKGSQDPARAGGRGLVFREGDSHASWLFEGSLVKTSDSLCDIEGYCECVFVNA